MRGLGGEKALGSEPARADARAHPAADLQRRAPAGAAIERREAGGRLLRAVPQPPNPAMHHAEKWPSIVQRMVLRMEARATWAR